jgi:hypothetical protein
MKYIIMLSSILYLSCSYGNNKVKITYNENDTKHYIKDSIKPYTLITFDIDNEDINKMGFEGLDSYTFGVFSMCFIDKDRIVLTDTYHNNLKMISISNEKQKNKLVTIENLIHNEFRPSECMFYKEKLIITDQLKNQFMIVDSSFKKPILHSFTSKIEKIASPMVISMYKDSLYIECSYTDANSGMQQYDVYNVNENRYYKNDQNLFNLLLDNVVSDFEILNDLKKMGFSELNKYLKSPVAYAAIKGGTKKAVLTLDELSGQYNLIIW